MLRRNVFCVMSVASGLLFAISGCLWIASQDASYELDYGSRGGEVIRGTCSFGDEIFFYRLEMEHPRESDAGLSFKVETRECVGFYCEVAFRTFGQRRMGFGNVRTSDWGSWIARASIVAVPQWLICTATFLLFGVSCWSWRWVLRERRVRERQDGTNRTRPGAIRTDAQERD